MCTTVICTSLTCNVSCQWCSLQKYHKGSCHYWLIGLHTINSRYKQTRWQQILGFSQKKFHSTGVCPSSSNAKSTILIQWKHLYWDVQTEKYIIYTCTILHNILNYSDCFSGDHPAWRIRAFPCEIIQVWLSLGSSSGTMSLVCAVIPLHLFFAVCFHHHHLTVRLLNPWSAVVRLAIRLRPPTKTRVENGYDVSTILI